MSQTREVLTGLFKEWSGSEPTHFVPLPASGSARRYFRLNGPKGESAIGAFNQDIRENEAFFSFTSGFHYAAIPVPVIYIIHPDRQHYLQQDLGDLTLFHLISEHPGDAGMGRIRHWLEKSLHWLAEIQFGGTQMIDFSKCYPVAAFDAQSMLWDLNYFKYYFLKLSGTGFDELQLEKDFRTLVSFLLEEDTRFFMYRDFQSRNIMIHDEETWFIDFQGGRKGALQYDLASFLYQAKAGFSDTLREDLFRFYLEQITSRRPLNQDRFRKYFDGYLLIRTLQVLGAYGFRGYYEKKTHFLQSVPMALDNLSLLLERTELMNRLPELHRCLLSLIPQHQPPIPSSGKQLTIRITSFSFLKGIPNDPTPNGGGFVFDCRALPNPGREKEYKLLTGLDKEVSDYLSPLPEVRQFIENSAKILCTSIENYQQRGFSHLMVSFGCTGGQHRSVWCAKETAAFLKNKFPGVHVVTEHRELGIS